MPGAHLKEEQHTWVLGLGVEVVAVPSSPPLQQALPSKSLLCSHVTGMGPGPQMQALRQPSGPFPQSTLPGKCSEQ